MWRMGFGAGREAHRREVALLLEAIVCGDADDALGTIKVYSPTGRSRYLQAVAAERLVAAAKEDAVEGVAQLAAAIPREVLAHAIRERMYERTLTLSSGRLDYETQFWMRGRCDELKKLEGEVRTGAFPPETKGGK